MERGALMKRQMLRNIACHHLKNNNEIFIDTSSCFNDNDCTHDYLRNKLQTTTGSLTKVLKCFILQENGAIAIVKK